MSRKFIFILFFLIGLAKVSYSCWCSILNTISVDYQKSDFVATVKIIKNYKNYPDTNRYYKADIEILNLYKGEKIKSIYVYGSNGNDFYNSCGTFIKEGEVRLVLGSYNKESFISTYLCTSYHKPLNTYYTRDSYTEKLNLLRRHASKHIIEIKNETALNPYDFKQIKNSQLAQKYSLIKIVIDKRRKTKKITFLTKETKELKALYNDYFTRVIQWDSRLNGLEIKDDEEVTLFFEIAPYKA